MCKSAMFHGDAMLSGTENKSISTSSEQTAVSHDHIRFWQRLLDFDGEAGIAADCTACFLMHLHHDNQTASLATGTLI